MTSALASSAFEQQSIRFPMDTLPQASGAASEATTSPVSADGGSSAEANSCPVVSPAHFLEATRAIFSTSHIEKLPEVIVAAAMKVMETEAVSLLLPGIDGSLYVAHARGLPPDVQKNTRVVIGEGIAGRVAESQVPVLLNGAVATGHGRSRSSIIYPLVSGGHLLGIITFNRGPNVRPFRDADLESAGVLASQVLLALENARLVRQTLMTEKLAAVGQLAAGIAHEINTPIQFIGDSVHFLCGATSDLSRLVALYRTVCLAAMQGQPISTEMLTEVATAEEDIEVDYLVAEMPRALDRTLEGVRRVSEIVQAVKSFGRAEQREKAVADLNSSLQTTIVVARPEYRHIADMEVDLGELPPFLCHAGDLNQVFLNLIVNASHAIGDRHRESGVRGKITIRTRFEAGEFVISIADTGGGIPTAVREKIFDPFFTTKGVGKGTGLGLAIARTIVVEKHEGALTFETELGRGTTFFIRLPQAQK